MGPVLVRWHVLIALSALAACNESGPQDQRPKEIQGILSWAATAHMVVVERLAGRVPAAYARRALDRAEEELSKQADDLRRSGGGQTPALRELKRLKEQVEAARQSLDRPGDDAVTHSLEEIEAISGRLRAMGTRTS